MSTGLENLRKRLADYLLEQGVNARTAWPEGERLEAEQPVVVVSATTRRPDCGRNCMAARQN